MEQKEFTYYAFISYRSKDVRYAKWVQRNLEGYRFPVGVQNGNADLPSKIFPIFRDKTDLKPGVLEEELKQALRESKYLIVICTPKINAINDEKQWVNREVSYFQELGRHKNIIPMIFEGEFRARNPVNDCFCPALYDAKYEELLGVDVGAYGRRGALLRVIASMMELKFDDLAQRERKRKIRRGVATSLLAVTALTIAGCAFWYYTPHTYYYRDCIYQNEVPVGVTKLNDAEQHSLSECYEITSQKGKVIRVEIVNSLGSVTKSFLDTGFFSSYPIAEYSYDDSSGMISNVVYKDENQNPQLLLNYTSYDGKVNACSMVNPNQTASLPSQIMDISQNISDVLTNSSNEITYKVLQHDENGFLIKEMYMRDNRNVPAHDANGAFGMQYHYDERGRLIQKDMLDENGNPLEYSLKGDGVTCVYVYDEYGRCIQSKALDVNGNPSLNDGAFIAKLEYNELGNPISQTFYGLDGNPCMDELGVARYEYQYNENGLMEEIHYCDVDGQPFYDILSHVHGVKLEYDVLGQVIQQTNIDVDGNPTYDSCGIASYLTEYDDKGRICARYYSDAEGNPAYYADLPSDILAFEMVEEMMSGGVGYSGSYGDGGNSCGYLTEYDGDVVRNIYLDENYQPALCRQGYAVYEMEYNAEGLLTEERFFDEENHPKRAKYDVAVIQYKYNSGLQLTEINYLDEDRKPCYNMYGASKTEITYKYGQPSKIQFYDTEGNPCLVRGMDKPYSAIAIDTDAGGNITSTRYYDAEGNPSEANYGIFEIRGEYDDSSGHMRAQHFYDSDGNLANANLSDSYATTLLTYDEFGNLISQEYLDKDGNHTGVYKREYEYDSYGHVIVETDSVIGMEREQYQSHSSYDKYGNQTENFITDAEGNIILDEDFSHITFTYDEKNRIATQTVLSQGNKEVQIFEHNDRHQVTAEWQYLNDEFLEKMILKYDKYGNQTEMSYYADEAGTVPKLAGECFKSVAEYNKFNNLIKISNYGTDGKLTIDFGYAVAEYEYNNIGQSVKNCYYDENGNLGIENFAYVEYEYDLLGYRSKMTIYDKDGNVLRDKSLSPEYQEEEEQQEPPVLGSVAYVGEVFADSPAERAGVQEGDCVLELADWHYFDFDALDDEAVEQFNQTIEQTIEQERTMLFARVSEETIQFYRVAFSAGLAGIRFVNAEVPQISIDELRKVYEDESTEIIDVQAPEGEVSP